MVYDVFVSYARKDNAEAAGTPISAFVERLKTDFQTHAGRPLEVFFDTDEIHGMADWERCLQSGLRESRLLLCCLSPNYFSREYCRWEFFEFKKSEIGKAYFGENVAPLDLLPLPAPEDPAYPAACKDWIAQLRRSQYLDFRAWCDGGSPEARVAATAAMRRELCEQIWRRVQFAERAERSPGNVGRHNVHFTGRKLELEAISKALNSCQLGVLTTVHGMGGLGKTELALAYAHASAHEYGGGRWQLVCTGRDSLDLVLTRLREPDCLNFEFSDAEKIDLELQRKRVLRELHDRALAADPPRCLLILDNVDTPDLLAPAQVKDLPAENWLHVLATSRLGERELCGEHKDRQFIPVDELPPDMALELLLSFQPHDEPRDPDERQAAAEIVRLLAGFTLAVEAAGVYLGISRVEGVTFADYLELLRAEGLEGLETSTAEAKVRVRYDKASLRAALKPTLERLTRAERVVLDCAALLPPEAVALPWVRRLAVQELSDLGQAAKPGYPDPFLSALAELRDLRLLAPEQEGTAGPEGAARATRSETRDALVGRGRFSHPNLTRMHPLLRELLRQDMAPETREAREQALETLVRERVAALVALVGDRVTTLGIATCWTKLRWELHVLEAVAWTWDTLKHPYASWLLNEVGLLRNFVADWAAAESLNRRALAIDEARYGPNHPKVAIRCNNLALLLQATNRLAEAEPLYRRALAIDEASFGPEHPKVAILSNNLAVLLQDTNRLDESELLLRRALAIDEASLGPEHPNVAIRCNNLAVLLRSTNRLSESELLHRRTLAIVEASLGPDHPNVATSCNNLASLLQDTNRLAEAELLHRRALSIDEACFGPEHPNVARDCNSLAELLRATKRLAEAKPLSLRALAIAEASLGPKHPNVARYCNNLALLLRVTNRQAEAEPLFRRALAIDEASFGPDHPNVARDCNNLAELLRATNRLSEAEPLARRALHILLRFGHATGHTHPNLHTGTKNHIGLLRDMGLGEEEIKARLVIIEREVGAIREEGQGKAADGVIRRGLLSSARSVARRLLSWCGMFHPPGTARRAPTDGALGVLRTHRVGGRRPHATQAPPSAPRRDTRRGVSSARGTHATGPRRGVAHPGAASARRVAGSERPHAGHRRQARPLFRHLARILAASADALRAGQGPGPGPAAAHRTRRATQVARGRPGEHMRRHDTARIATGGQRRPPHPLARSLP